MLPRTTYSNEMQERTRTERNFVKTESDLSNYSGSDSPTTPKLASNSKLNDILSYLGSRNPLPRNVSATDTVWLLDNTAYRNSKTGKWEAEFVSAVFAKDCSSSIIDAVSTVAKEIGLAEGDPGHLTIGERINPFLQDIRPGTKVNALHQPNDYKLILGPGGRNGISNDVKKLPDRTNVDELGYTIAQVPKDAEGLKEMKTFYAEPEGWGVISDIDDTIKVTMTSDPIGILRSTFVDKPTPCTGMPELYAYLQSHIPRNSPFFYLSASPYNLYPFLREFRTKYYPHGTIILRDSSWMSLPGLLSQLTLATGEYKVDRMKRIHSWLPQKKMICIGDSTQADPESYGEIYRAFPGWVMVILIRKVTDIAAIGIEAKNEPERFEKAFKGVPREKWHVFEHPAECRSILQKVVNTST
ncbi:hypothetical protein TruAng_007356 [Truncatella angustata]|nr:hypothetical protein TruAng_007356 [Truncatella angustata]